MTASTPRAGAPTILIVEDDDGQARLTQRALLEQGLEVIARLRRSADFVVGFREHVEGAHQVFGRELGRQRLEPIALALGSYFRILEP